MVDTVRHSDRFLVLFSLSLRLPLFYITHNLFESFLSIDYPLSSCYPLKTSRLRITFSFTLVSCVIFGTSFAKFNFFVGEGGKSRTQETT
jgi:hypothetical protein